MAATNSVRGDGRWWRMFAWLKWAAGLKRAKLRGPAKVSGLVKFAAAAYNLRRLPKLQAQAA